MRFQSAPFHHAIVPMDGTKYSEAVLPLVLEFKSKLHLRITLLHIIEPKAPEDVHGQSHLRSRNEAQGYLQSLAIKYFGSAEAVDIHVHEVPTSAVAGSISDHTKELSGDLVMMCTHGEHPLRRWFGSNLAQQVFGEDGISVLVVPISEKLCPPSDSTVTRRILAPWDGDAAHEAAIDVAQSMAQACGAALDILTVVPTAKTLSDGEIPARSLLPGATRTLLELTKDEMESKLDELATQARARGIQTRHYVRRGPPIETISRAIAELQSSLVVLGTHGRHGFGAFWEGSTGARLLAKLEVPILMVALQK